MWWMDGSEYTSGKELEPFSFIESRSMFDAHIQKYISAARVQSSKEISTLTYC
jgi:hypothetical protein